MSEDIFIRLLNEGTDAWRSVKARKRSHSQYKIVEQTHDEKNEDWEFKPGDAVVCKEKIFSDNAKRLVAYKKADSEYVA